MSDWQLLETAPKDGTVIWAGSKPLWVIFGNKRKWCPERQRWVADFGDDGWLPTIGEPTHWWPPFNAQDDAHD